MRMLMPLLRKEVKELLMERSILMGMIIVPLIMFPIMGALTSLGVRVAAERAVSWPVMALADLDGGNLTSIALPKILRERGLRVAVLSCSNGDECIKAAQDEGFQYLMIIPPGFAENFTSGLRGEVDVVYFVKSLTLTDLSMGRRLSPILIDAFRVLAERVHGAAVDPEFFTSPISQRSLVVYLGGRIRAPLEAVGSAFMTALVGLPLIAVLIASYASSVAATSVALEKESKTLEILLTMPVSRASILLSKLLGTFLIVLLGTISFIAGLAVYAIMFAGSILAFSPQTEVEAVSMIVPPIQPSPMFPPILLAAIFTAMVMTTCIGLLVGILGGDVRSAQQLVGAVSLPLLMPPFFTLLFASIDSLPLGVRIGLLADPFTHLFLAIQAGFMGDLATALVSLGFMIGFTALLLLASSRLFMGERLITMRILIGRRGGEAS